MTNEVDRFFDEYVFGFMATDVHREIESARMGEPAGNYLCALALLCYTEILGGIRRGTLAQGESRANFDAFFRDLGPSYATLLDAGENIYRELRCGMAHEFLIKGSATVAMLKKEPETAGIARPDGGPWKFCVEAYMEAFDDAAQRLRDSLSSSPEPRLPPELRGR